MRKRHENPIGPRQKAEELTQEALQWSQTMGCSLVKDPRTKHEPDHTPVLPGAQETLVIWELGGGSEGFGMGISSGSGVETGGAWSFSESQREVLLWM